jgi:hypothetical protein
MFRLTLIITDCYAHYLPADRADLHVGTTDMVVSPRIPIARCGSDNSAVVCLGLLDPICHVIGGWQICHGGQSRAPPMRKVALYLVGSESLGL